MAGAGGSAGRRTRGARALMIGSVAACITCLFLGSWQVQRRAWKLDLIERVEQRVHASPTPAPGPAEWPAVSAARDEYRRVQASGRFLHERETLVQAVTELGSGFWVLTPLQRDDGSVLLVNRGFVPADKRNPATRAATRPTGAVQVTGLLRITEPRGGFLRHNDAAHDRWYSRDVEAIAAARHVAPAAPYFIDAQPGPTGAADAWPRAGLTVIRFPNNHLVYILTWYALAIMAAAAAYHAARRPRDAGEDPGAVPN